MWGAAAPRRRLGALLTVLAASLLAVEDSAAALPPAPDRLPQLSAVSVDRGSISSLNRATLKRLRARGVNALVLQRGGLSRRQQLRVTRLAARSNVPAFLPLVESRPSSWGTVLGAADRCRTVKRARPQSRCAVLARTIKSARRLARQEAVDLVVVRVRSTRSLRALKALPGRVLAVRALRPTRRFRSVWRASIRLARSGKLDLAVAPSGRRKRSTLIRYAGLLRQLTRATDVRPPTMPKGLQVTSRGTATISLGWSSARDNRSVAGYGVYRDGTLVAAVSTPAYTSSGLDCGTRYAFAVDAVDAAGNRSMKSTLAASTDACTKKVYSMTPVAGATVGGTVGWEAGVADADVMTIDFLIDGVYRWTETNAPYVRTWDTTEDPDGPHTLTLVANLTTGATLTSSIEVTVDNGSGDVTPPSTPTVHLSPIGSDGNACTASAPCKSFDRAYRAAKLGDVVELAAGTYPNQVMEAPNAKAPGTALADLVVFRPATGAAVKVGSLDIRVPHVEFRDMEIATFKARYDVRNPSLYASGDLTFRNIKTHSFSLNSMQHVRVVDVDVGPNRNPQTGHWPQDGIFVGTYPHDARDVTDILFDRVYVHDVREPTSDAHSDCVQFTAGIDVIIRNSRFENCEHADLMIKADQGPIDGFLIENNFFDHTLSAYFSINLYETSRGCRNVVMRYNTALQNIRTDACSGGRMIGNIQPSMADYACSKANVTLGWNVYESGVECGSNDVVAPVAFVDRANFDLRLAAGSAAINRGNPSSYPEKDIDGQARPKGGAPDAGAHERS